MEILSLVFIAIIAFFPILIWGYIFSYLDNSVLSARRFLFGIFAGSISVIPVLFISEIMTFTHLTQWNIFPLLLSNNNIIDMIFSFLVMIGLIAMSVFIFSLGSFSINFGKIWKIFIKNTCIVGSLGILFGLFHLLFSELPMLDSPLKNGGVTIGGIVFGTLKLVLFYYIIIAVIEEASKHFCFITSSLPFVDSVKKGVLFSVFIALGFGFIENILYLKNISEQSGILSSSVIITWIFRSIFSLMTHIICSVVIGLYFSRAFITYKKFSKILPYAKTIIYGFVFSIIIHAVFDIALTVGFTGIIFIYFFGSYLSITRIFYEENDTTIQETYTS